MTRAEYYRNWVHNQGASYRKKQTEYHRGVRKRNRDKWAIILKSLSLHKCSKCGYSRCTEAIDIHENPARHGGVTPSNWLLGHTPTIINRTLVEQWVNEKKWVALCANCHRELHAGVEN